ncbi:MAG TPA: ABC transporter permease [Solirubrobacteraceae bacterium]|jgi:peptide/nickel transport system permease protein|nr:ABC transporter permease [Solirubrobacteraceae bacterium]
MTRFLTRRLLLSLPILIGVSIVVFITIKLIPGNPVAALLGPNATPQARAALSSRLGLNDPLPVQYLHWLWAVLHGNLGTSISLQSGAGGLALTAFANTMILVLAALVIALAGGVVLGLVMALAPRSVLGRALSSSTLLLLSAPQYSVGLLLVVFAVKTGAFPSGGMHSTNSASLGDLLAHLVLPAVAAALAPMGIVARMFSVALSGVLEQEFVSSMSARGLRRRAIIGHAVHNAVPSLLTITGLQVAYLLGGVLFVETIFDWPGIGQHLYQAISSRDEPLIEAGVLFTAVALVLTNVLVDTLHAWIDPRVRA